MYEVRCNGANGKRRIAIVRASSEREATRVALSTLSVAFPDDGAHVAYSCLPL